MDPELGDPNGINVDGAEDPADEEPREMALLDLKDYVLKAH